MDLSVRHAAQLLAVSIETMYAWIQAGSIPAHRVNNQYRLNRAELQEWAAAHGRCLSPLFSGAEAPGLAEALERGGIHAGIVGTRREELFRAIAELPCIPELDRELLFQLLLAREALGCTCLGGGVAIPHPRDPLVLRVPEPHVVLCFPSQPLDLGAPDGQAVRVLFLLLSPSVQAHLELLGKLSFVLHDDVLLQILAPSTRPDLILERIRELERSSWPCP